MSIRWIVILMMLCSISYRAEGREKTFHELMGSTAVSLCDKTSFEEKQFLEFCAERYDERREATQTESIPKTIHCIWLGPRPFPAGSVAHLRSWMAHHPTWRVKFWTDRDIYPPCEGMEVFLVQDFPFAYLRDEFISSKNPGEQSDLLRLEILYREGGVYVDHDANCLAPFDSFHNQFRFYGGLETIHPQVVTAHVTLGNGLIGSVASHPLVLRVMENIKKDWIPLGKEFRGEDGYTRTQRVMERTYIKLTEAVKESISLGLLTSQEMIFPAAYFFAKNELTPLYSTHFFANSWADLEGPEILSCTDHPVWLQYKQSHRLSSLLEKICIFLGILSVGQVCGILVWLQKKERQRRRR